jgi:hypothetical protein
MMKYKLLGHPSILVHQDDEKFLVGVPLIMPSVSVPLSQE